MYRLLFVIISMCIFVLGCGQSKSGEASKLKNGEKDSLNQPDSLADAIPVQIVRAVRGNISSFLLYSSNIDAERVVQVYPMTSGIITQIFADEGQTVVKGQELARLDDREASINEAKARLNYDQQKNEYDRQQRMFEKSLISQEEMERVKLNLEKNRLEWEQMKLMLSYTRVVTPIEGVVTQRLIKEGNKISTSQHTFTVVENRDKIAVVHVPQQERSAIYLNQKGWILAGDHQYAARVKRLSPAIDPQSGTFKTTIGIDDPTNRLAVGQFVNVQIIRDVHENVILLTKDALIYDGKKIFLFVLDENNHAQKKEITIGFDDGRQAEITSGITLDDRIVSAGKSSLKSDILVKIIETE